MENGLPTGRSMPVGKSGMTVSSQPHRSPDRRRRRQHRHREENHRRERGTDCGQYERQSKADVSDHVKRAGESTAQALRRRGLQINQALA